MTKKKQLIQLINKLSNKNKVEQHKTKRYQITLG